MTAAAHEWIPILMIVVGIMFGLDWLGRRLD